MGVAALGSAVLVVSQFMVSTPRSEASVSLMDTADNEQSARLLELEERIGEMQQRLDAAERRAASAKLSDRRASGEDDDAQRATASVQFADVSAQPAAPTVRAASSSEEQEAADRGHREQTVAQLEEQLAVEDYDSGWAGNFQANLDQGLKSQAFLGTRLTGVECKSSLCRVTLGHDNVDSEEQFFEHVLELPMMANTQAYYTRESGPDGSSALVMYVARQGQALGLPKRSAMSSVN